MANQTDGREARIKNYARETAVCVDVALASVEDDIRNELDTASDTAVEALRRVLAKLDEHRKILEQFTKAA